jgi:hypothetical protein
VASQVRIANAQFRAYASPRPTLDGKDRISSLTESEGDYQSIRFSTMEGDTPEVLAHGLQFVALPGKPQELQKTIPEALRLTLGSTTGFCGCMILVSEQEARLMTVITLWTGRDRAEQCDKNSDKVDKLLLPYVDTWLRTQRMTAFLCWPHPLLSSTQK